MGQVNANADVKFLLRLILKPSLSFPFLLASIKRKHKVIVPQQRGTKLPNISINPNIQNYVEYQEESM